MSRLPFRRTLSASALLLVAALVPGWAPSASADDSSTVTVVGTSDVYDSALIQDIIKPGFEAAYPQYTLNYVSKGTGAAIAYAQAGTASALLVHAAALENQFVAGGYSAEPYGRAIFWGDYVLLGPASDPAGVLQGSDHDIVGAFQKIAAAGASGKANFVSRGGTPGTTVQEHAIWALSQGVPTCTVSAANGGGTSPSNTAGNCPSSISYPSWYHATGLTQGPNILNGDTCNYPTASGGNNCYVFTDRGTFNFLQSTGAVHNMQIVTRDNNVPGQETLLVNSFHAYAINPEKFAGNPNVQINSAGAQAFLDWVTSRKGQAQVASFLNQQGDGPFRPSAAPSITSTTLPKKVAGGTRMKIKGTVANVVPGTPALSGIKVRLKQSRDGTVSRVGTAVTDTQGKFVLKFTAKHTARYTLHTNKLTRIEDSTLNPIFGDLLAPAKLKLGKLQVKAGVTIRKAVKDGPRVSLRGTLQPKVTVKKGRLVLFAKHPGKKFHRVASRDLGLGKHHFDYTFRLGTGTWKYKLKYANPTVVKPGTSPVQRVTLK